MLSCHFGLVPPLRSLLLLVVRLLSRSGFCKFIFGSHPYYAMKPLYFQLVIKIFARLSLPLAPMFLGHLYVQLDIIWSDEN